MVPIAYVGLATTLAALAGTLWFGVRRRDEAIAVNAVASLGAVAVPSVFELLAPLVVGVDVSLGPMLTLWIAVAGLLHMLGMLGWYDDVWWWDHVTHTVSAALVAALVYAWALVVGPGALPVPGPLGSPAATAIVLTMAGGAFWELLEWAARDLSDRLGIERVLERYGRFDTPLDLVFDLVGAVIVVALDVRLLVPAFEPTPGLTASLLRAWVVVLVAGSLLSLAIVVAGRRLW